MSQPLGQLLEDFYNKNFNEQSNIVFMKYLTYLIPNYLTFPDLSSYKVEEEDIEKLSDSDTELSL